MKNELLSLSMLFTVAFSASAIDDYVISTFEDGATGEHGVNILTTSASGFDVTYFDELPAVRNNPMPGGINTSSRCVTQTVKGTAKRWGGITYLDFASHITPEMMAERPYMKIMVWRDTDANNFRVSLAKNTYTARGGSWNDGTNPYIGKPNKGEWVDVVLDLTKEVTSDGTTNTDPKGTKFKWMNCTLWSVGMQNIENASSTLGFPVTVYYDNVVLSADPMPRGTHILESKDFSFDFENYEYEGTKWLEGDTISSQNKLNTIQVIDNPYKDAINQTNKVIQFNKSADCNWWEGGPRFNFKGLLPLTPEESTYIHSFVYLPSNGTLTELPVTVQLYATDWTGVSHQVESDDYLFDTDTWVDLVMEINTLTHLQQFAIRFDVQKNETGTFIKSPEASFYVDGVILNNDPNPREVLAVGLKSNVLSDRLSYHTSEDRVTIHAKVDQKVRLYTQLGHLVGEKNLCAGVTTPFAASAGFYLLESITANGQAKTYKIVIR